ncbi:hypothetical protein ACFYM3_11545 [Streptomyces massasporeus]|uniref:Uncharacterized protein n=1 Tax=Streptomyces massasporeus TaxID=67324 RepID=A0ABW6LBH9_9ACTN
MKARTVITARQSPCPLPEGTPVRLRLLAAELCASLLLALVRLLLPARGRHRVTAPPVLRPLPPHPLPVEPLVMDTPLVRPYLHSLEVYA